MVNKDIKFLIIDDSISIRKIVSHILSQIGYTNVFPAKDGEEAYKILVEHSTKPKPIQFIISDWNLPKMSGLDFLKKCRAQKEFALVPFLLVTAVTDSDIIRLALTEGITDYINKPFSPALLKSKLDKYIIK